MNTPKLNGGNFMKNSQFLIICIALFSLFSFSCATMGGTACSFDKASMKQVQKGSTTEQEAIAMFGEPDSERTVTITMNQFPDCGNDGDELRILGWICQGKKIQQLHLYLSTSGVVCVVNYSVN